MRPLFVALGCAVLGCAVLACGEPEPDARSEDRAESAPAAMHIEGVHPGPVELPSERMQSSVMLDRRLLEDPDEGTMDPDLFPNEAPLDLSIEE